MINHLRNDPAKILFTDIYGPQVPAGQWNTRGSKTKQGVYCMMPDGTYLGALFVGVQRDQVAKMLQQSLETWRKLVAEKKLTPLAVPKRAAFQNFHKEEGAEKVLIAVHYRDLPRENQKADQKGRAIGKSWNQNWLKLSRSEITELRPATKSWVVLPEKTVRKIAVTSLKDIVYGQSPAWKDEALIAGKLEARLTGKEGERVTAEYRGTFQLRDATHAYNPTLIGEATWEGEELKNLRWFAAGPRSGGTQYNFREGDPGPASLGISFVLAK